MGDEKKVQPKFLYKLKKTFPKIKFLTIKSFQFLKKRLIPNFNISLYKRSVRKKLGKKLNNTKYLTHSVQPR